MAKLSNKYIFVKKTDKNRKIGKFSLTLLNKKTKMSDWQQRTRLLVGEEAAARLRAAHVLIVGVGGVGAYAAETIARAGVGKITLVDGDTVSTSNINRQLPALHSTVGLAKVDVVAQRIADINPEVVVDAHREFITAESAATLLDSGFDYVVDAIDSISAKVALIAECQLRRIKIISSMGAGGRIDPTKVQYADLWATHSDGLARAVRERLKQRGLRRALPVVWSSEQPRRNALIMTDEIEGKRSSYGTVAYLPAMFGLMLGAQVIRKLTQL